MEPISFKVPGVPVGKQRARTFTRGDTTRTITPQKTKDYEQLIRDYAAVAKVRMIDGPVHVEVGIGRTPPASWSKRKQEQAIVRRYATGKPDIDNVLKTVLDALKGIAYPDDTMVARIGVVRVWGPEDAIKITVGAL